MKRLPSSPFAVVKTLLAVSGHPVLGRAVVSVCKDNQNRFCHRHHNNHHHHCHPILNIIAIIIYFIIIIAISAIIIISITYESSISTLGLMAPCEWETSLFA